MGASPSRFFGAFDPRAPPPPPASRPPCAPPAPTTLQEGSQRAHAARGPQRGGALRPAAPPPAPAARIPSPSKRPPSARAPGCPPPDARPTPALGPRAPILALRSAPLDAEGTIRRYRPSFSAASGDRSRNSMGAYPGRFFAAPSPHQTTLARPSGHQRGTRFDVAASVVRILYTYQVPASGTRCARPRRGCTSGGTSRVGIRRRSASHDRREADRDRMQVIPPVDPYCICDGSIGRFAPNGDGPCGRGDAPIALQICGGFRGRGKANFLLGMIIWSICTFAS